MTKITLMALIMILSSSVFAYTVTTGNTSVILKCNDGTQFHIQGTNVNTNQQNDALFAEKCAGHGGIHSVVQGGPAAKALKQKK